MYINNEVIILTVLCYMYKYYGRNIPHDTYEHIAQNFFQRQDPKWLS